MPALRILNVIVKRKWFDMIASGEKKEEYRDIKPFWYSKLRSQPGHWIDYDLVLFQNGYRDNARRIYVEFKGAEFGEPKQKWSDGSINKQLCFVIKLGKIVENPSKEKKLRIIRSLPRSLSCTFLSENSSNN